MQQWAWWELRACSQLTPSLDHVNPEKEDGGPQAIHDQACSGEEAATKSLHSAVDTNENREYDPIQLEAENVA